MRTNLKERETVIFKTNQHWYFLIMPVIISSLFLFVSLYLFFSTGVTRIVPAIILAVGLIFLIYKVYERKYNIWVITNLRLIDEEGVFTVRVKESPIDKINNVTYVQTFLGRILGFGDVEIQTAAEQGATIYNGIALPRELSEALTTVQEKYKHDLFTAQAKSFTQANDGEEQGDLIECPFCAEKIKAKAKICRYCGRELPVK